MAEGNPRESAPETSQKPAAGPPSSAPREAAAEGPRRYTRSKRGRNLVIAAAVLVAAAAGYLLWRYLNTYESTDDAEVDVHLYPVSARISGYVIQVNVGDNQWVEKGAVLVEIDPRDYEVAVKQAQANLANAEATARSLGTNVPITAVNTTSQLRFTESDVESARAGINLTEKQYAAAHAQLEQTQANDVDVQNDLRRYKMLVEKQEVAVQVYDKALAVATSSTAAIAAARANEAAAQQAVTQAHSRLEQAEANHNYAETGPQQVSTTKDRALAAVGDVEQKRAALEQAELNL